jgi:hypothetical protein
MSDQNCYKKSNVKHLGTISEARLHSYTYGADMLMQRIRYTNFKVTNIVRNC